MYSFTFVSIRHIIATREINEMMMGRRRCVNKIQRNDISDKTKLSLSIIFSDARLSAKNNREQRAECSCVLRNFSQTNINGVSALAQIPIEVSRTPIVFTNDIINK